MAFLASDNHACTQKTDASHDALNHAAGVGGGYRMDRQNCQGRAETQDAEGAYASRLSMQIAVEPEHDSNQGCSTEPKRNVESVHTRKNSTTTASLTQPPAAQVATRRSRTCAAAHHWARELCKHESDLGDLSRKLELSDILQHRQKALIAAVPFVSCWPIATNPGAAMFWSLLGA
jgi:hypothetical protein